MALHTVGELKDGVSALLQNIDLDTVTNLNGALERSARTVVQQADIPEASGVQPITLYGGVSYYAAPTTIFGGAINLIRRQGEASAPWDYNYKVPVDQFTRTKNYMPNGYMLDIEYRNGVAMLGISTPITFPKVILDPMNETTGWAVGGSASGLAQDTTNYYQSPASLRYTLTGASSGYIEKTLTNPIDLSVYEGVGVVFLAINTPSATNLTAQAIRIGSSSTNYVSVSDTDGFLGAWTANNWLLVALDLAGASETGTVDWENIDYIRVTSTTGATITNFRVGSVFISLPSSNEILFQSSAIFLNSSGVPTQAISGDGNTIVLNDAAYQLYEYESALSIAVQQGGTLASNFVQMLRTMLYGNGNTDLGLYAQYRADNPSAELRMIGSYYDSGGYDGGYGGRFSGN